MMNAMLTGAALASISDIADIMAHDKMNRKTRIDCTVRIAGYTEVLVQVLPDLERYCGTDLTDRGIEDMLVEIKGAVDRIIGENRIPTMDDASGIQRVSEKLRESIFTTVIAGRPAPSPPS